jgi:hypothetical protein
LPVLDATAAAIDVGSEQLHVSIAGGPPKIFGTTTGELHGLRDYLLAQGARTVAMEATGIYWLCAYEVLEKAGLEVVVVNGKYVKNLPGRKTDMSDCQWQATLHAQGSNRGLCRRSTSAECRIIFACALTTSSWRAVTSSTCRRRWNG